MKPQTLSELFPSLIRTYVPSAVGALLAWLLTLGININDEAQLGLITFLTALLTALYYTVIRFVERKYPVVGLLLGSKKQPVNVDPEDKQPLLNAKRALKKDRAEHDASAYEEDI